MKTTVFCALFVMMSVAIGAQDVEPASTGDISHGEFAVLLLKAAQGVEWINNPEVALEKVKEYDLVSETWELETVLTHGELSEVLARFGAVYVPANADDPVSQAFAEVIVRRELSKLRDYLARRMGHGFSTAHVLDEGVDRAVSPSGF
jgi:hypothetical protein